MNTPTQENNAARLARRVAELRALAERFSRQILRGREAPFKLLFAKPPRDIVAGPAGSLLYAMARIPVRGNRSSHRRLANRALWTAPEVQATIAERFVPPGARLEVSAGRNPRVVDAQTGALVEALEWHHSPNHIMSLSLIPRSIHRLAGLHTAGRGAFAMFSKHLPRKIP